MFLFVAVLTLVKELKFNLKDISYIFNHTTAYRRNEIKLKNRAIVLQNPLIECFEEVVAPSRLFEFERYPSPLS